MRILTEPIQKSKILQSSKNTFDDEMVKAVVDIKRKIIAIDAELHADLERFLLDDGSGQYDLWGINLYPESDELVEFDSMINIRPSQGNHSRYVEDPATREQVLEVVKQWVE